jgi:hypothetical protein
MNDALRNAAAPERLEIGTHLFVKNQQLVLVGHRPHTRLDGTTTELTIWRAPCAICGDAFEQTAPWDGPRSVLRTCPQHRGQLKHRRRRQKTRKTA